jgi:hypothetical protein
MRAASAARKVTTSSGTPRAFHEPSAEGASSASAPISAMRPAVFASGSTLPSF